MTDKSFSPKSFDLLEDLRANNKKEWYAENSAAFKDHLTQPFVDMLVATSERLKGREFAMSGGAQTMFRQNRGARFNKGPDAYHRYVSGMLSPSGTKLASHGVVYARLTITGDFYPWGFMISARSSSIKCAITSCKTRTNSKSSLQIYMQRD